MNFVKEAFNLGFMFCVVVFFHIQYISYEEYLKCVMD